VQFSDNLIGRGNPVSSVRLTHDQTVEADTPPHISRTLGSLKKIVGVAAGVLDCIAFTPVRIRLNDGAGQTVFAMLSFLNNFQRKNEKTGIIYSYEGDLLVA
jgi:hypothetical protein